jgi:hypothetical protein
MEKKQTKKYYALALSVAREKYDSKLALYPLVERQRGR